MLSLSGMQSFTSEQDGDEGEEGRQWPVRGGRGGAQDFKKPGSGLSEEEDGEEERQWPVKDPNYSLSRKVTKKIKEKMQLDA